MCNGIWDNAQIKVFWKENRLPYMFTHSQVAAYGILIWEEKWLPYIGTRSHVAVYEKLKDMLKICLMLIL